MKKFIIFNIIFLISLSDLYSNTFNYDSSDGKDIMMAIGGKGKKQLKCKRVGCISNANQKICGGRLIFNDETTAYIGNACRKYESCTGFWGCMNGQRCVSTTKCKVKTYTYVNTDLPFALMGKLSKKYNKINKTEVTDENGNKIDNCRVRDCSSSLSCKDVNYSNEENIIDEQIEIFRYEDQSLVYEYNFFGKKKVLKLNVNNNCSGTSYAFPSNKVDITAEILYSPCSKEGCIEWETDALDILSIMPDIGLEAINTDLIEY